MQCRGRGGLIIKRLRFSQFSFFYSRPRFYKSIYLPFFYICLPALSVERHVLCKASQTK